MENQEQNKFDVFLEKTKDMAQSVEILSKSLLADQEARKQEAELRKSELEAEAELKKSEHALENENLAKENKMLKSQIKAAGFANIQETNAVSKQFMKSEDLAPLQGYSELVKNTDFRDGSKPVNFGGGKDGHIITAVVLNKSSSYSLDSNPLGGYTDIPGILPITNQTNYSNEEKLFDLVGYSVTQESNSVLMPKFVYAYDSLNHVKVIGEGKPYSFNPVEKIMDMQTVNLNELKAGFPVSQRLYESTSSLVSFLSEQLGRDIRRSISREMLRLSNADAKIKSIETVNNVLDSTTKTTAAAIQASLDDLFELANLPTLHPDRFIKPVLIVSRQFISKITRFYNNYGYPNGIWINEETGIIKLPGFAAVPYISLDNETLMPSGGDGTAGKTAAILMDADAYRNVINPSKTLLTNQYNSDLHSVNIDGMVSVVLRMMTATAIIDNTRIAKLVIKA